MFAYLKTCVVAALMGAASAADPTKNIVELAESVPELKLLVEAVVAANLTSALEGKGPLTVFAPTNEAFMALGPELKKLLEPENKEELVKVLTYHVASGDVHSSDLKDGENIATLEGDKVLVNIDGSKVYINHNSQVISADNDATNGVVHIVDHVLIPHAAPTKNIVELAESIPELKTLVSLVSDAGLVSTLEGKGPFTVFAPPNEAFERIPKSVLDKLKANKTALTEVLTYHVASGDVHSNDLKNKEQIKTVEGEDVTAYVNHDGIFINHAKVVIPNVDATNGVVHVIDSVLIPN